KVRPVIRWPIRSGVPLLRYGRRKAGWLRCGRWRKEGKAVKGLAVDARGVFAKLNPAHSDGVIALAGNPNTGKSTVFNGLTGLNQHTGNWPGKTVVLAKGNYRYKSKLITLVDLPGTYSLLANSADEQVARDFICFGKPDATVVVVDATCLERNLNL